MDPFLEDPVTWPDVHHSLISAIRDQLVAALSPDFYVRIEERLYITHPEEDEGYPRLIPDVVVTTGRKHWGTPQPAVAGAGVAAIAEPALVEGLVEPEIHDRYIEIHDARSHAVVTAIELLSPANQVNGSRGREAMIEKRKRLRRGGAHWLEIDLLRAGERHELIVNRSDYGVTLLRNGQHGMYVWFIDLRDPLPTVAVPLRPPFDDAPLELQRALGETYDRAHYGDSVDYARPIPPPLLKPADVAWVQRTLEEWRASRRVG
jgi:hypothetical protein